MEKLDYGTSTNGSDKSQRLSQYLPMQDSDAQRGIGGMVIVQPPKYAATAPDQFSPTLSTPAITPSASPPPFTLPPPLSPPTPAPSPSPSASKA
ncbi:hypothetical protein BFJ63_vAg15232 [Fusarium oxysporum f. sp. narcissi]|uniref:Uncharacterized protein n=1 Tax=Fusarium oxysporum f. sp. narcissi TaxID=451672 RepID=A0A4Q2V473_FUSOX|nr:hypothetical protein BFJ63_vAg15232 [Fusarium oxysporum f. sp. narcissi]